MTTTWTLLQPRLVRLLPSGVYAPELQIDAINAALAAFSAHTAKRGIANFSGDGASTQFALPADFLGTEDAIEGIQNTFDGLWLEQTRFVPGDQWAVVRTGANSGLPEKFWVWPDDKINFFVVPGTFSALVMYYYAAWPEVVDGTSVLSVPLWAYEALLYYAAAYCLAPSAVSTATIRQYAQKQDLGSPDDNPVGDQVKYLMTRYQAVLSMHQAQRQSMGFTPGPGR